MDGINLPSLDIWRCLVPLIALLVGWAIGFVDSNQRTAKKIKAAENKAEIAIKEAQDKAADAESRVALLPATVSDNSNDLLRLKNENDGYVLELDGQKVPTPSLSPEQKRRLIGLLTIMRPWLEAEPAVQQTISRSTPPVSTIGYVQPAPKPTVSQQTSSASVSPAVSEVKADSKKPAPKAQSIVEQIDAILQDHLINTPLARRDIRVQESREGGVEVMVGLTRYETVDAVPDPEIKSAIRAAIEEWEKKYTPGL